MELITNPRSFLSKPRKFSEAILIVSIAAIISALIAYSTASSYMKLVKSLLIQRGLGEEQVEPLITIVYYTTILSPIPVTFISWFATAAILYLATMLVKGKGPFKELLKLSAFSFVPPIILSPLQFYISHELSKRLEIYGFEVMESLGELKFASIILSLAVSLWQYVYWTYAVNIARNLDIKKSAIVALIPLVLFAIISLVGFLSRIY